MVAGESGSGKSFTASKMIDHLVAVADMSSGLGDISTPATTSAGGSGENTDTGGGRIDTGHLTKLVACRRTILESLGNAATVRWIPGGNIGL